MSQRRCAECSAHECGDCDNWYDAKEPGCPCCGAERPAAAEGMVKAAHASKVNDHLFGMQTNAEKEKRTERLIMAGNRRGASPLDRR